MGGVGGIAFDNLNILTKFEIISRPYNSDYMDKTFLLIIYKYILTYNTSNEFAFVNYSL